MSQIPYLPDAFRPVRWWRRRELHRRLERGWWRMAIVNYRDPECGGVLDDIESALRELEHRITNS